MELNDSIRSAKAGSQGLNRTNSPNEFSFSSSHSLQIIQIQDKPWFVAADICEALELPDVRKAVGRLDEDEKLTGKVFRSGQSRSAWLVNESGLYALIMRSNKPVAKSFRKWVTNEVLPAIRQTGSYQAKPLTHPELAGPKNKVLHNRRINTAQLAEMLYDICLIGNHVLRRRLADQLYNGTNVSRDFNTQTS